MSAVQPKEDGDFDHSQEAFLALLDAVRETARGRWFIEELITRSRGADTRAVIKAINELRNSFTESQNQMTIDVLRRELQDMVSSIDQTRKEIAAIKPDDPADDRISAATEELDAVVNATEKATTEILAAAERMQEISDGLEEYGVPEETRSEIEELTTNIFMACSFQDITGQRTTKVVQVLQYLEHRVRSMIEIWGLEGRLGEGADSVVDETADQRPDSHLLNGPQMEGAGVGQDDVDALFSSAGGDDFAAVTADAPAVESAEEEAPESAAPEADVSADAEADSDDDIDLAPGEPAGQDDIDKLFA